MSEVKKWNKLQEDTRQRMAQIQSLFKQEKKLLRRTRLNYWKALSVQATELILKETTKNRPIFWPNRCARLIKKK